MAHSRLGLADGWGKIQNLRLNQDKSMLVSCQQVLKNIFYKVLKRIAYKRCRIEFLLSLL